MNVLKFLSQTFSRIRVRIASYWLAFYEGEEPPAWISRCLEQDPQLQEQVAADERLRDALSSSAEQWTDDRREQLADSPGDWNSPAEQSESADIDEKTFGSSRVLAVVAAALIALLSLYSVSQLNSQADKANERDEQQFSLEQTPDESTNESLIDWQPILASAQASQMVVRRIAEAAQDSASRDVFLFGEKVGLSAENLTTSINEATAATDRVGDSLVRMLSMLSTSDSPASGLP